MKSKYDISLRPIHYACVSGGKDSLYMLGFILSHLDKYPLDLVVHYELEIDWPWVHNVIDKMEDMCIKASIKFVRIKPRISWLELYELNSFPSRVVRWCLFKYKLDADRQVQEWISSLNCRPIAYIGLCSNENKRFKYSIGSDWDKQIMCYPLAEEGIEESFILEWAKNNPIFGDWYKYFNRQGCMFCPYISMKELAYMFKYYPVQFHKYGFYAREFETKFNRSLLSDYWDNIENRVKTKWLSILEDEEQQISIFDFFS